MSPVRHQPKAARVPRGLELSTWGRQDRALEGRGGTMSQHRLRVPEPESLGQKRTSSEDNLYLAVLRASEGKKGSGHSPPGRAHFLPQEAWIRVGVGPRFEGLKVGTESETGRATGRVSTAPGPGAELGWGWGWAATGAQHGEGWPMLARLALAAGS